MPARPDTRSLRLLVVDDDSDTLYLMVRLLESSGHVVFSATGARKALALMAQESVDMILLDVMMPDMDGFSLLEMLRRTSDAPILMLTALSDPPAIERGFQLGADDYIVKPFHPNQLLARLERLANQLPPAGLTPAPVLQGRFSLDPTTNLLRKDGRVIELTPVEARLLQRFLKAPGRVILSRDLFRAGWDRDARAEEQSQSMVQIAVNRLRVKIEFDPTRPNHLLSENGSGYKFHPD